MVKEWRITSDGILLNHPGVKDEIRSVQFSVRTSPDIRKKKRISLANSALSSADSDRLS